MKFASLFLVIGSLATSLVFADQQVDNFSTEEFDSALSLGEELMDSVDPEALEFDHAHRRLGVQSFKIRLNENCTDTESGDETQVDEGNHRQCAAFCKEREKPVFTLKNHMCRCNNKDCKNCLIADDCKPEQAQPDLNSFVYRIKTDNVPVRFELEQANARCAGWNGKEFQDFYKVRPKKASEKQDCAEFCHGNYALEWFSFNSDKNDRNRCICWAARDDCEETNRKEFPGYSLNKIIPIPTDSPSASPSSESPSSSPSDSPSTSPTKSPSKSPTSAPSASPTATPTASASPTAWVRPCTRNEECIDRFRCTKDRCDNGQCINTPIHHRCDDEIDCTEDICDPDYFLADFPDDSSTSVFFGCRNAPVNTECNDNYPCCDATKGCVNEYFCKYYFVTLWKLFDEDLEIVYTCGFGEWPTVKDIETAGCSLDKTPYYVVDIGEGCETAEIPQFVSDLGDEILTSYAFMPCKGTGCDRTRIDPIKLTCAAGDRHLSFLRA